MYYKSWDSPSMTRICAEVASEMRSHTLAALWICTFLLKSVRKIIMKFKYSKPNVIEIYYKYCYTFTGSSPSSEPSCSPSSSSSNV